MPFDIRKPPEGSCFQLDYDESNRPRLSWKEPTTWAGFLLTGGPGLGLTAVFIWFLWPVLGMVLRVWTDILPNGLPDNALLAALVVMFLILVTAGSVAVILTPCWALYTVVRGPRPSRLTLNATALRFSSGSSRWVRSIPRADVGEVRVENVQDAPDQPQRERLMVDHGAKRIEVGKDLRPSDRAWLAGVIREWISQESDEGDVSAALSGADGPPVDSMIIAQRGEDGRLVLRWKPELPVTIRPRHRLMDLSVWLFIWAIGEIVVVFMFAAILTGRWAAWGGAEYVMLAVMLVWLSGWTWGGIAAMRMWWGLLRGPAVQRLDLTPTTLHYQPGRVFDIGSDAFRTDPPRVIPQAGVGRIAVERTDKRQRLTVDHGAERTEIGPNLRGPEREWLAHLLREWAGQDERAD